MELLLPLLELSPDDKGLFWEEVSDELPHSSMVSKPESGKASCNVSLRGDGIQLGDPFLEFDEVGPAALIVRASSEFNKVSLLLTVVGGLLVVSKGDLVMGAGVNVRAAVGKALSSLEDSETLEVLGS